MRWVKYNFDEVIDRRNTGSLKWDVGENELPMWVADMDFRTAPEVTDELVKIAQKGVFGYSVVTDRWYDAYIRHWEKLHAFKMKKEGLCFVTGVVPLISSAVRKLTTPAEKVIIQTPTYNIFFNSVINNGRRVVENPLKYDSGRYEMDFSDLEEKLSDPETSLLILCNPQNPTGNIWDRETLSRLGELCKKHSVTVISDEIHCDITTPGKDYVPFASVSETCKNISITALAPTKAFNLAGIGTAAFYAENENLFNKMRRALNTDEVAEPNVFAVRAAEAAFFKGDEWLGELKEYIYENKTAARRFIGENIPKITVAESDATYLLWLDVSHFTDDSVALSEAIREKTGLYISEGAQYGGNGRYFLRLNTACPRATLNDGLSRLKKAFGGII